MPTQLDPATTMLVGSDVIVVWPYPSYSGGLDISKYRVTFMSSTGTYYETLTYCDGSDMTILANQMCTVPMSVFSSSPFSLSVGDLI